MSLDIFFPSGLKNIGAKGNACITICRGHCVKSPTIRDIGHIVKFHMLVNIFSLGIIGDLQTYTLLER